MIIVAQCGTIVNFDNVYDIHAYENRVVAALPFVYDEELACDIIGTYETAKKAEREIRSIVDAVRAGDKVYKMSEG